MDINWKALIPAIEALIDEARSEEDIVDEVVDLLVAAGAKDRPFLRASVRFFVGQQKPGVRARAALARAQRRVESGEKRLARVEQELQDAKGAPNVDAKKVTKATKAVKRARRVLAQWKVKLDALAAAVEPAQ